MNLRGIYCYRDLKNNGKIVYIGKDANIDINRRHNDHTQKWSYNLQQINRVVQNNPDRYKYEVILKGDISEKLLNAYEMAFIRRYDPLFNFTIGGDGRTGKLSEETKRKISENNAKYWNGKKRSDETKKKISEANKGKKISDEHKKRLSELFSGEGNPFYGKKHSEESKKKMSDAHIKKYARIKKYGFTKNGKQNYCIKRRGKLIKSSINPSKLLDYFTKNYPKEILILKY